jgi:Asp-tRNA(Asn)/Glu-tRNA(Gln) amidotransferase A subunit family amidase
MLAERAEPTIEPAAALETAGAALRCLVATERPVRRPGPVAGSSYVAKDMFDMPGRAPTLGLPRSDAPIPVRKAALLDRLDGAGAIRLGFSEMTALACEPSGSNPRRGRPLNPWNPDRICGGSSSGSAVAVAAGLVDFAIGSDTAGSLRIPAQCCGVSAWKPTPGLLPTGGAMRLAPSLDALGVLARDTANLRRVAALFAPPRKVAPAGRIGVASDLIAQASSLVARACTDLQGALARQGMTFTVAPLGDLLASCDRAVLDLLQGETSVEHGWRLDTDGLDAGLVARLRKGVAISPERVREARDRLGAIAGSLSLFQDCDAVLLPVMAQPTPAVAACEPGSPGFSARTLYGLSAWTRFVNGLGLPAVALPCGFDDDGMPVAAQLVGPPGSDLALLDLAVALQAATDWHRREPAALAAILEAAR